MSITLPSPELAGAAGKESANVGHSHLSDRVPIADRWLLRPFAKLADKVVTVGIYPADERLTSGRITEQERVMIL